MPSCLASAFVAAAASNFHAASERTGGMPPRSAGTGASSGTNSSAGPMRSSTPAASASGTSVSVNAPDARLSHAIPARLPCGWNAASRQSRLASSRFASVSVPGVTMRAMRRSTGPLLVAGSPNCSTITTDSPCFISLARCGSSEWYGTPAIGMGAPADCPRDVSVMSSSRDACSASA